MTPAPTPPEVLREQVARAMHETPPEHPGVYGRIKWERLPESGREAYRRMADAALAVFRDQQDPAVQRVLELADWWEREEAEPREERAKSYPPSRPWAIDHAKLITRAATYRTCAANLRRAAIGGDGR